MEPSDLAAFWQDTLARAAGEPLDAAIDPVADPAPYYTYEVSYRSWQGRRIKARLGVPVVALEGARVPAIVTAPGYGGWEHGVTLSESQRGHLILQVYPRDQGISGDRPRGQPREGPGPLLIGIENPEGYYYQGAYVDMIRGIDYLVTRTDVDPDRIGLMGTSQGGGIVLAVAGLDQRVKATVAHVPFLCDIRHHPAYAGTELADPNMLATFDYFDPVNLAPRVTCPTLVSTGGKDQTCPAATIRAVFDRLAGIKALAHYPDLTHTSSADFYRLSWEWMARHLGR